MKVDLKEITVSVFKSQTENICLKFREAAKIYTEHLNDQNAIEKILNQTDALLFKFTLAVINLEFLWKISDPKDLNNKELVSSD